MNKTTAVNNGRADTRYNIDVVEKKYNAKYVGQLAIRTSGGGWSEDDPAEVFFQEVPPVEGYSQYFALITCNGVTYITSGASAVEGIITAVEADNGEIIYSRARHDYRISTDQSTWIDGGRDYSRMPYPATMVYLKIIDGEFYKLSADEVVENAAV